MIKYKKVNKPFKAKKAVNDYVSKIRKSSDNQFDRVSIRKVKTGYVLLYATLSKSIREKIRGIERMSTHTSTIYDYYQVAMKPEKWITAKYAKLKKETGY